MRAFFEMHLASFASRFANERTLSKHLRGDGVPQAGEALLDVVASLALQSIVVGALVLRAGGPPAIASQDQGN